MRIEREESRGERVDKSQRKPRSRSLCQCQDDSRKELEFKLVRFNMKVLVRITNAEVATGLSYIFYQQKSEIVDERNKASNLNNISNSSSTLRVTATARANVRLVPPHIHESSHS